MSVLKYLLITMLFTTSCSPQAESKEAVTTQKENIANNNSSPSGGGSSSGGGGSSSSGSSSSSSGSSPSPSAGSCSLPVNDSSQNNENFRRLSDVELQSVSFADNVLTTPLFQMHYNDVDVPNNLKKSSRQKEDFLTEMYYQFLANVTFGNEVYTVSRVDFVEKGRNQIPVGGIDYDDNSLDITFFSAPDHKHYVFSAFAHEYYHHIGLKLENILAERSNLPNFNDYLWNEYMKFYNDGWKQLEQNIFDPHAVEYIDQTDPERPKITTDGAIFPILRLITYNREMDEYYNRHFSLPNNKLVSFNRPRGGVSPKIPFLEATFAFQNYKLSKTEVFARWTTMMTNGFLPLRNNLPYLQRGYEVEDYLKALFGRTNVYYAYDKLKRSYPKKIYEVAHDGRYATIVKDEDHLTWNQIKEWKEQTPEAMRAKYQEWKDYFEKIFYNNDQLLSGVIRDKDNNLHLELNKPNSNLSLQRVSNCEPIGLSAQGFRQVGQITFNLKPYAATSRQKTTLNNNFLYKIDKSQLTRGIYYLLIDNQYLDSGLRLTHLKDNTKTVFGYNIDPVTKARSTFSPQYKFYKLNDKIVLEVI